ncbi:MAG: hypothetical protein ACRCR9_01375 [Chitinophagaceae bacterium]
MPPKYFVDTIIIQTKKGKTIYDTIFRPIKNHTIVTNYTDIQQIFDLGNLFNNQVTLYYWATCNDTITYKYLKQLTHLKKQLRVDSFLNILCFVDTTLPDSFLISKLHFLKFQDTVQQKKFWEKELKLSIHPQMLPFIVLVDKQKIIRNYYLLNNLNEENFLLDIILINLEKEKR